MAKVIGTVQSETSDRSYNIIMSTSGKASEGETVYCNCPAWRYSKTSPRTCKHLKQWRQSNGFVRSQVEAPATATVMQPRATNKRASDRERMRTAFSQLRHRHGFSVRMNVPGVGAYRRVRGAIGNSVAFDRRQSVNFRANGHLQSPMWVWFRGNGAVAGVRLAEVFQRNGFVVRTSTEFASGVQGLMVSAERQ